MTTVYIQEVLKSDELNSVFTTCFHVNNFVFIYCIFIAHGGGFGPSSHLSPYRRSAGNNVKANFLRNK